METIFDISLGNGYILFKKKTLRSLGFYPFLTKDLCLSVKIKFSLSFMLFQINQSEKSSTHLLIDNKISQWSKVNNFLTLKDSFIEIYFI